MREFALEDKRDWVDYIRLCIPAGHFGVRPTFLPRCKWIFFFYNMYLPSKCSVLRFWRRNNSNAFFFFFFSFPNNNISFLLVTISGSHFICIVINISEGAAKKRKRICFFVKIYLPIRIRLFTKWPTTVPFTQHLYWITVVSAIKNVWKFIVFYVLKFVKFIQSTKHASSYIRLQLALEMKTKTSSVSRQTACLFKSESIVR